MHLTNRRLANVADSMLKSQRPSPEDVRHFGLMMVELVEPSIGSTLVEPVLEEPQNHSGRFVDFVIHIRSADVASLLKGSGSSHYKRRC